jgi:hypothetical protein
MNNYPGFGEVFALTGPTGSKCIANGNSWSESKLTPAQKAIVKPEWDKMQEFLNPTPHKHHDWCGRMACDL